MIHYYRIGFGFFSSLLHVPCSLLHLALVPCSLLHLALVK